MSLKHIAVLTSGGDSPGMNPALRAVVRTALYHGLKVTGIRRGYQGLLEKEFVDLEASSVGNILQRGGTFLKSSRCLAFHEKETRDKAFKILQERGVEGLVVIGGDGSYNGAFRLGEENNFPVVGIPGSIDNDISGSDYSVGFYTAVQTAVEAVDKIRDTASSHDRNFIVEVMGRNSSAIANHVGICSGAETVIEPGTPVNYKALVEKIRSGAERGKKSSIIIVAEGKVYGRSYEIMEKLEKEYDIQTRVCILGHTQRGGSPMAQERFLATQMGHLAVKSLILGNMSHATVVQDGVVQLTELKNCITKRNHLKQDFSELLDILSI